MLGVKMSAGLAKKTCQGVVAVLFYSNTPRDLT